jgi:hypothetical protein
MAVLTVTAVARMVVAEGTYGKRLAVQEAALAG